MFGLASRPDDVHHRLTDQLREHACATPHGVLPPLVAPVSLSSSLTITRCGVATAASLRWRHTLEHRCRSACPSPADKIVLLRALSFNVHVRTRAPSGRVDTCDRRYQTWPPVNSSPPPPPRSPQLVTQQQKTRHGARSASRFAKP